MNEGTPLWEPSEEAVRTARISDFMRWLPARPTTYDELWQWSVSDIDGFWEAVWRYFHVVGDRGDGPVRQGGPLPADGLRWFSGARVNYAENLLRHSAHRPAGTAVLYRGDDGSAYTLTWGDLAHQVAYARAGLLALGVGPGDRVAGYVPNRPEALVLLLAAASLGAVWACCPPDFTAPAVIDRFRPIGPKVLIAVDGHTRAGRTVDRRDAVAEIQEALPTLTATVTIPVLGEATRQPYEEFLTPGELAFDRVPFDHPLWILHSSGTTGPPKPIVHGHGGMILEHAKSLALHQDIGPGDTVFWCTTTGWAIWNYQVSALMLGATVVLSDAAPTGDTPWALASATGTTHLGLGARLLMASRTAGLAPGTSYDLSALRFIGSTGAPLPPEGFRWVYQQVKQDVLLGSLSGGTDVCTCFVGPCPLLPVRAGIMQCRTLGAKTEVYAPDGRPLLERAGELVVTEPMPCMPLGFWNDDGTRHHDAYFAHFPGAWRHGDWAKILPDGGCVIYGRSDSTLNRGGDRMGTDPLYRIVEAFPEVADSLVVDTGHPQADGTLILYLHLTPGRQLTADLANRLRTAIGAGLSPHHVPDEIVPVPGIPRTLTGKKLEVPVRRILQGTDPAQAAHRTSLAAPELLDHFARLSHHRHRPQ
ncbi:acetoacetate--CoA ligase [Streptomyces niveiscabiei]|uniref:acetoacetate--CoA ligase n=1 Tax=Streptomyces niveiscabiei TaxID=164115 RepID=UPI0006EBDA65|nr:acetoacetate--CoA ligase [Streptomyces niveiscabiei]